MEATRPSWQRTPCPDWCRGGHEEGEPLGDRMHRSAGIEEDVRARRVLVADGALVVESGVEEFVVGLARADGEATTWLYVGSGVGQQIDVDLRDVPRLVGLIERMRSTGDAEDRLRPPPQALESPA